MQISSHNETQAHLYGLCNCEPGDDLAGALQFSAAMDDDAEDVDEDNGDRPVRPAHRPAERKLSDEEIARRRRARRRF